MRRPDAADLLLGVDAGTTLLKAALYAPDGVCLGAGEARQRAVSPRPDWVEQEPATWRRGLRRAVRQALNRSGAPGERVAAIGLSTQGGTLAVFDERGRPRGPALVWSDSRQRAPGDDDLSWRESQFELTGCWHLDMSPSAIRWLQAHRPEWFREEFRIGYVPDYLVHRLTGEWASDATNLGISNLCDLATGDIALPVLERLGVSRDRFAATRRAGEVAGSLLPAAARALGLRPGIPVAAPAHDQYAAALGAGCTEPGDLLLSAGTAWAIVLTTGRPLRDRHSSFWPGRHIRPGRWGLLGAISTGGSTLNHLLSLTRQRPDWETVDASAAAVPAGSDGMLVIPHLAGRTLPTRQPAARGALLGWSFGHGREHVWRAAMEGLAMETRLACDHLAARGADTGGIRTVGGAARSPLWPRILASVLGVPVRACAGEHVACRGAASLAARALGKGDLPPLADWQDHRPVQEWTGRYLEGYARYRDAVQRLEDAAERSSSQAAP